MTLRMNIEELKKIQQDGHEGTESCSETNQPKILTANHITESQYNALLSDDSPTCETNAPGNITENPGRF